MPHFYAQRPAGSTGQPCRSVRSFRQMAVRRQIAEPGQARFELQFDCAGGPWRCLPMMISALPCTSDMSSCHFSYSGVPARGSLLAR